MLLVFIRNTGYDPSKPTGSTAAEIANAKDDAQRIAHVTSAVIGCLLGGALAVSRFVTQPHTTTIYKKYDIFLE